MDPVEPRSAASSPQTFAALSGFAFLIGSWQCEAKLKLDDGRWQSFAGTWRGQFILDGYAIADEYRMTNAAGELVVLGMNFRTYQAASQTWRIQWLNAPAGTWTDLASEEFGGVIFHDSSVTYTFREPMAAHPFTRATYTDISRDHVTWRGEKSEDRRIWTDFMVVEVHRCDDSQR